MNRISQYFKKLFPSTPKGDLIPNPTKREVVLTKKAASPHPRHFKIRRTYALLGKKARERKVKNNGLPVAKFGGTFTKIRLLPGQKSGMERFRERESESTFGK